MRPSPIELFAFYHLGLDSDGSYKFRNVSDCARRYKVDNATVQQWLREAAIDPETVGQVPFNLARFHVDAQFISEDKKKALVQEAWSGYQQALRRRDPSRFHHHVDYDDLWGDGKQEAP